MEKLLVGLNDKQQEAVRATEGPVLIIAAAGSGKTRVLTHRIAHLIKQGVSPHSIMAVTFTNKAAGEMKERIIHLLREEGVAVPLVGTFHSICAKFLRREVEELDLPYNRNFVIYDSDDQLSLIKKAMEELEIDPKKFNPRAVLGRISQAKNDLATPAEYADSAKEWFEKNVAKIYPLYQKSLESSNAVDFDDLLFLTVKIFQQHPKILERYQDQFRYLLVDEYQDTNKSQYLFLKMLAKKYQNIMAVGDDYQSIYMFRQADIRNILSFEKDYPQAKIIFLEQNYRSTQTILAAAQNIIANNKFQRHKNLWTKNVQGEKIHLQELGHEREESNFVAETVREGLRTGKVLADFCVLYRTHAQSRAVEEAMLKHGLPYRIIGGLKFYERKEIKDILAYLRLVHNPTDWISLERVINVPARGIGKPTYKKLLDQWEPQAEEGIERLLSVENIEKAGLNKKSASGLLSFGKFFDKFHMRSQNGSLSSLIKFLLQEVDYQKYLEEKTTEADSRWENVKELLTVTNKYNHLKTSEALPSFLEEVSLVQDSDKLNLEEKGVTMMTMHAAKGLEFPTVFMVGMEESVFPHARSILNPIELEEERRLCYVGITRAKEKLYLTYCRNRTMYGSSQYNPPSRFLEEIPEEHFQRKITKRHLDFNWEDYVDYDE
ncbi:MAG: UvrD-helicase domain-containing protein [bacterium]|nr:UvrD-helicase domain-containing protein [bacterium]